MLKLFSVTLELNNLLQSLNWFLTSFTCSDEFWFLEKSTMKNPTLSLVDLP